MCVPLGGETLCDSVDDMKLCGPINGMAVFCPIDGITLCGQIDGMALSRYICLQLHIQVL